MTEPRVDPSDQRDTPQWPTNTMSSGVTRPPNDPLAETRFGLLAKYHWLPYVLPFAVYMLLGLLEPKQPPQQSPMPQNQPGPAESEAAQGTAPRRLATAYRYYPLAYTMRIAATVAAILFVLPGYRQFPLRTSGLAIGVGCLGIVLWVGVCWLELESKLLVPLGAGPLLGLGERAAFDPLAQLADRPGLMVAFLAIRFFGLAAVVPLIEEFFLRGFLMRLVTEQEWWKLPIGQVSTAAIVIGTLYGALSHPAEMFAAAVWFSLVTWLMIKTRNIWDCVVAHAVTNLLLGLYVLRSHDWSLW